MDNYAQAIAISLLIIAPALGVGIGQGLINKATLEAINQQPGATPALKRLALISTILSETAVLLGVVMGLLLMQPVNSGGGFISYAYMGIVAALGIPSFAVGIVSAYPGQAAIRSLARQPLQAGNITQIVLLTQTVIQTSTIFGFIIALLLRSQLSAVSSLQDALRLCASGVAFGLATIGPLIGLGRFTRTVCTEVGLYQGIYPQLRTFTFISQALIEAPIIFGLIISLILAMISPSYKGTDIAAFLAPAFIMGLTALGAGVNSARIASQAAQQIGGYPGSYAALSRMSILSQTFIDTSSIYGLLVSLFILLTRS